MGIYLNPRNTLFADAYEREIYVDHSLLIEALEHLKSFNNYFCVSRPRRFGKSTDAFMISAYYSRGCQSDSLFDSLKVSQCSFYKKYLNQCPVIFLNMQNFLSYSHNINGMLAFLTKRVMNEVKKTYPLHFSFEESLSASLEDVFNETGERFIFIVDEWDCIFREYPHDTKAQKIYLDFLRDLFKDKQYINFVYMTGILPIKKYGTHSALNMFDEISMVDADGFSKFMGFTESEVKELCLRYNVNFEEMKNWYDGYHLSQNLSTFSPRSVVAALGRKKFGNYWNSTETYEALKIYIDLNYQGLKDAIIALIAGEKVAVDTGSFQNDMTTFASKDDVLTLLVHLGYLSYNSETQLVSIPNREVLESFVLSIKNSNWQETTKALQNSEALLQATWNQDEKAVAEYIEEAHLSTSILTYNNENALAYTISIAYFTARNEYNMVREMPTGKGFADIAFIPYSNKPAMIIELKWDKSVETALSQVENKEYFKALQAYHGPILLIGINYNSKTKKHSCKIKKKII